MLAKSPMEFVEEINLVNEDMFKWDISIKGPADTPYAGGTFVLRIEFPTQYPFKAPSLKFITKIYHPSVKLDTGDVCTDVVGAWGPTLNAKHCIQVVYSMMQSPESDHPLEESVAQQLREKPKEFEKMAKKYTKEHAK
jgi:ubiquitin-protein ligase